MYSIPHSSQVVSLSLAFLERSCYNRCVVGVNSGEQAVRARGTHWAARRLQAQDHRAGRRMRRGDGRVNAPERDGWRIADPHRVHRIHPRPPSGDAAMEGIDNPALSHQFVSLGEMDGQR